MKIISGVILLLALVFTTASNATSPANKIGATQAPLNLERLASSMIPITGLMDNLSGDTYYAKFSNSSSDTYRVYYTIKDGDKMVQDETSMIVKGNSSNSNGPYHCSPSAILNITKTEKI
ncbi:MAG TPA: hypothetical protein VK810_06580 [Dongiaceae bacterium]|jgi:hypothetical protein|nr:hypothetical protein [Dongiaceae bacterium]